jgi:hypothetical protein
MQLTGNVKIEVGLSLDKYRSFVTGQSHSSFVLPPYASMAGVHVGISVLQVNTGQARAMAAAA